MRVSRFDWALVAVVVVGGVFLRLWQLNALGFNSDEAVYTGQGAAIAGDATLSAYFPIFRAHPLLFQFFMGLVFPFFSTDSYDTLGRVLAVLAGLLTVFVTYKTGELLYGRTVGLIAALIVALTPYHVVVSRQVLLDGPMALAATVTLYCITRYVVSERREWLYVAGAAMGLTVLAKEPGIVLVLAIFGFFAISPDVRVSIRDLLITTGVMILVILPYPLSLVLAGGGGSTTANQYLNWQLFRRPNHDWTFYVTEIPMAIGPLVVIVAIAGLIVLRRRFSWRERLLLTWIVVPFIFFQLWPVKGFQYLLPVVPPIALLVGWVLIQLLASSSAVGVRRWILPVSVAVIAVSMVIPSWLRIQPSASEEFLAGSGGVPGGREAGEWVRDNTPRASTVMTIGPSMANIVQFYGHRKAYGLSISPNPLHRNPSYDPIENPDLQLRNGEFQYIIWDTYSASRSSFFSEKLLMYARRYNGRVVHTESITVATADGETEAPVIVVYEVRP